MPLYEYQCTACHRRTEVLQRFGDPPPVECPECGGELRKLLSAPAFQFKGSGWYATDYASKSSAPPSGSSEGEPSAKSAGASAAPSGGESGGEGAGAAKSKGSEAPKPAAGASEKPAAAGD